MLTVVDLFRIGLGPSSSHTVGPMRIARRFLAGLDASGILRDVSRVHVELQGSLALTGAGHGTLDAVVLGLMGFEPDTADPEKAAKAIAESRHATAVDLLGRHPVAFSFSADIDLATTVISHASSQRNAAQGFHRRRRSPGR